MTDGVATMWPASSGCVCCAAGSQNSSTSRVIGSRCIWQPILPIVSVSDVWLLNSLTHALAPWCVGLFIPTWEIPFQCHSCRGLLHVESVGVIMGRRQWGVDGEATVTFHSLHVWVSVEESQHAWIEVYWSGCFDLTSKATIYNKSTFSKWHCLYKAASRKLTAEKPCWCWRGQG